MHISKNPATEEILKEYEEISDSELDSKIARAAKAARAWRHTSFSERAVCMQKLAALFREEKDMIGKLITLEMGRPISAAVTEAEKCAWVAEYYAAEAEQMLAPQAFPDGLKGEVRFEPLGVLFAVMPWNYPFWQVMRFLAPALMAGNVGLLKHASNVPQSVLYLQDIVRRAGFPEGVFQNLFISIEQSGNVIDDSRVAAVTITGSVKAGSSVAERAGKNLKKVVLELGGSDPFIVLKDADIKEAAKTGAAARLQNAGQTCIAAKRFIIEAGVYDEFLREFEHAVRNYTIGDPMEESTMVGPLASEGALKGVTEQVARSIALGAKLIVGGEREGQKGYFYQPTILTEVKKGMPAYDEEIFGPVASVIKVKDEEEAIMVANDSEFGLSSSLWTKDIEKAKKLASRIEAGCVYINSMSKSDPRMPFGGIKKSGYGRELGEFGIKEFVNVKAVSVTG